MESFSKYLQKKELSVNTILVHKQYVTIFFNWLQKEGITVNEARYSNILDFVNYCRNEGRSTRNINRILCSVRYYYNYLSTFREIKNPAATLFLKGTTQRIPHGLLEYKALESLYEKYEIKNLRTQRNKVILGLLIYQAVTTEELKRLEPTHTKLKEGKIYIPGSKRSNNRVLKLEPHQIMEIHEYLNETRPQIISGISEGKTMLQPSRKPDKIDIEQINSQLFISINGSGNIKNSLLHLFIELRKTNPQVRNAKQIRMSVITEWLKTKDLREVQYMAGHKYVSSTERYKIDNLEDLQKELEKYHPLK